MQFLNPTARWCCKYLSKNNLLVSFSNLTAFVLNIKVGISYKRFHNLKMVMRQTKWLFLRSALPGGNRNNSNGSFNNVGNNGNWWSSTENSSSNAYNRNLNYNNANVNRNNNNKSNGFSVRCLRDLKCIFQRPVSVRST